MDVLLIDELGKGNQTKWELSILDMIISHRYNSNKMTLFSTNYTEDVQTTYKEVYPSKQRRGEENDIMIQQTLQQRVHDRIYSRLKEMCVFCEMPNEDRRQKEYHVVD